MKLKYILLTVLLLIGVLSEGTEAAGNTIPFGVGVPVLLFHRVDKKADPNNPYLITVDRLRGIFKAIKDAGFRTITIEDLNAYYRQERELPKKSFLLTFDDGYVSNKLYVDPLLEEFGFHAVLFLNILMQEEEKKGYLSWRELSKLYETGRWDFQAHGYRYHSSIPIDAKGNRAEFAANLMWLEKEKRLETLEEYKNRLYNDLKFLKKTLEEKFPGDNIIAFAFPFGEIGYSAVNLNPVFATAANYEVVKKLFSLSFAANIQNPEEYYLSSSPQLIVRFEDSPGLSNSAFLDVLEKSEAGFALKIQLETLKPVSSAG